MDRDLETLKILSFTSLKLRILECLDEPKKLSEISENMRKPKQTIVPHLRLLVDLRFIVSVNPYKIGDDSYPTPYVEVVDVSGKSYDWWYWWHKDDDPMTYEVEFYSR